MNNWSIICLFVYFLTSSVTATNLYGAQLKLNFNSIVKEPGHHVEHWEESPPISISFATPLEQVSNYWRQSIDSFKTRMDELGIAYTVTEFSTKVDENRRLKESISAALKTNPDYLVLTPNDRLDIKIISSLLAKESPKVIIQNVTIPNDSWKDSPPFMYVGFNQPTGTKLVADEYIQRFEDQKDIEYAMLYHVRGNQVSELRGDSFNKIIEEEGNFKLIAEYFTEGNRHKAKAATLKIIHTHPNVAFIYACSTDIAFGVLDALKESNLAGKILVNGWGGGPNELASIMSEGLDFTVMRMNDDNGVAMAEAIRLDLENKVKKVPIIFSGEMVIVKQGIGDEELRNLKQKAFRYSGSK